ncbi:MAG: isoprenylcysteine carboxylmethyltransferase family protein [Planctomycetes bacterium]|nr:isoprenylcysteine carboxylmethyltransferase family protein [Planctomycetota bacterium]
MAAGETWAQRYFRYRGWIPLPLYLSLLAPLPGRDRHWLICWSVGIGIVFLGSAFRVWAIRHIGRSARTRTEKTRPLVFSGPYAIMRNPLYVANILIAAGFAVCAGLPVYAPALTVLLFIHYHIVARCEERGLRERHGEDYERYVREVPRWFPRRLGPAFREAAPNSWREAFYRERSGILGLLAAIAILAGTTWFYVTNTSQNFL